MLTRLVPFFFASVLCAQSHLSGTLRDPAGLPIAGARVTLTHTATAATRTGQTSATGEFHFPDLLPGSYSMELASQGFQTLTRDGLVLRVGDRVSLELALAVGDVAESVQITAEAPLLESSRGTVSFVADPQKVTNLPLDGRNFIPLIALAPGVSLPPGSVLPRINGSRPRVSEYIYDGISVLQPEPGQVAYFPIPDAIEEFRVETNAYSAEYGRANGGVILVTQKSGSNRFHGSLFQFFRNEALNARNLFATAGARPRFRRNQYGYVLGGPIRRNRTFFFTGWQGTRLDTAAVRISTVPGAELRDGRFSHVIVDPAARTPFPANTIPASRQDPVARRLLHRFPLPTAPGAANNYTRSGSERTAQDQFDTRIDQYAAAAHRFFARLALLADNSQPFAPLPDGSGAILSGIIGNTTTRAASLAAEHTWTPAPSRANQLRFGYTRRGFDRTSLRTGQPASQVTGIPNLPAAAFPDALPAIDITGFQTLGAPSSGNADFTTSVTQFVDTYTWIAGRHNLKLGADIRRETLDVLQPPNPTGAFQFTSQSTGHAFASFLLGQVQRFQADLQDEVLMPRATVAEFFLQDDLRLTPRLAANLGVRYTLNFPSTVRNDRGAVFNLHTQKLDFLGRAGFPRTARNLERANFGPRLGLAFRAADTLAVRAGYGLTWIEQAGITTPFTTPYFPFIRTVEQAGFVLSQGPAPIAPFDNQPGQAVFAVQRDQKSGYAQQWNLSIQKTFHANWSIEAGYLGSKLTNLGVPDVNLNQVRIEHLAQGQFLRPYPGFANVALYRNNVGHSTYHSLQARLERRFARGFTASAAYTFSRLIDDAGAVFDSAILTGPAAAFQASDSHNRRLEKDVSTGDIPHIFSASLVWEFFRGWQIASIVRAQSGSPFPVIQQPNLNAAAGFGIQRPNLLRNPQSKDASTARWFDVTAFAPAPQHTLGNASRNPVRGPGYQAVDLMIGRTFALSGRLRIDLRAEAFNVANTPPLAAPNGSFGTPAFGTITRALDPRVFELVAKLHF